MIGAVGDFGPAVIHMNVTELVDGRRGLKRAARRLRRLANDVGDDRKALHVDSRRAAPDHFDTLDIGDRDALQDIVQADGFCRGSGAVDQHIAGAARKAARRGAAAIEDEAGQAAHHVARMVGIRFDKERRDIGCNARAGLDGGIVL